jgi:predicted amidohydrolase YtcJ
VLGAGEAVSRADAIRHYTADPPYLSWEEDIKGTLEPGKLADLIVLNQDIMTVPDQKILDTKVDLTMVGGKLVYQRN